MDERRAFGQLEGKVEMMERDLAAMKDDLAFIRDKVSQADGGWKMLLAFGGFIATLASFVTWAITTFWKK